ncbi:MAG: hypothetical protein H6Q51_2681 [Deltaproteobacteria bacterium]|nr:hypothetical protein [Deltaproteobacteria bacterium]
MTPKRIAFLVLGVLLATFFIQNAEAVPVRFLRSSLLSSLKD